MYADSEAGGGLLADGTYDVTADLAQGANAIAALVAPGWYSTPLQWFQQPNVYGSPPPNTYAGPGDAPQIFYAQLSPTVVSPNSTVRINAITTTNVQKLTIGTAGTQIGLSALRAGQWQGVFSANTLALPPTAKTLQLTLTASRGDGQSASIQIPVALTARYEDPL